MSDPDLRDVALVAPDPSYETSYLEAAGEFQADGHLTWYEPRPSQAFADFVAGLLSRTHEASLPPGVVPDTVLWLVTAATYIGRLAIRHRLNDKLLKMGGHIGYDIRPSFRRRGLGYEILRLGLEQARELGHSKVLLTCDDDNLASAKIIEHYGGILENVIEFEGIVKRRYWITLEGGVHA